MVESTYNLQDLRRELLRPTRLPMAVVVLIVLVAAVYADYQNGVVQQQRIRNKVLSEVSVIRAKLEGHISSNLQLVRGLTAVLATEPEMGQARFTTLAGKLVEGQSQLRNIAVAPGLVITMVHPYEENRKALGFDYRTNAAQSEAALRARDTGELVLAGPVKLVQGGSGFIGRFPVFLPGEGPDRFWGVVAAVIDEVALYRDSGLYADDLAIDVAIAGRDSLGAAGAQFFGPQGLFDNDPVRVQVALPSGSWVLGAIPKGGWYATSPETWLLRGLIGLLAALILVPLLFGARLIEERQRHIRKLRCRESELEKANRLSEARNIELEATRARIEHNALHDSLTGLPNRRFLEEVLTRNGGRTEDGRPVALLHIDLDRFQQINDTLGHAAGDAVLAYVAGVLRDAIGTKDLLARVGGDEFVVVCDASMGEAGLAGLATSIIETLRRPARHDGHEFRIGVSIGIAAEQGAAVRPLLIDADIALHRAKARGRSRYEFFTKALQGEVVRTKHIADEILNGIENGEFVPHYQPQFDAHSLDVVGLEALARWNHPTDGLLGPNCFLEVAEDLGVVAVIDRMVLEQSLRQFDTWAAADLGVPRISVNVSARRLQDEQLIEGLKGLGIRPGTVSFELVESIFLDEADDLVLWNIDQIKDLGIDVEIDDFGTGHASIVSLLNLRPRRLKIDRQLVRPVVESVAQRHLVASIIEIGKSLEIQVVGEGIETMEHARIMGELGCDILQGYALGRPMAAEALSGFLKAEGWRAGLAAPVPLRRRRKLAMSR